MYLPANYLQMQWPQKVHTSHLKNVSMSHNNVYQQKNIQAKMFHKNKFVRL